MKYKNATDILPANLIKELQQFAGGQIIYIPKPKSEYRKWGEVSGGRQYINERNKKIRNLFDKHRNISQLADTFSLSQDSIKKIVYCRE